MICKKCEKEFEPIKGLISYCSLQCRNSRGPRTEEFKRVVSSKLIKHHRIEKDCERCGIRFQTQHARFCSRYCASSNNIGICQTYPISLETRRKVSATRKLMFEQGQLSVTGGWKSTRARWFNTWFGTMVYLRSQNEIDYAEILNNSKIKYSVEKLRIRYYDSTLKKERIAIPDFYIPESNLIVEIKSSYTFNKSNLKDRFKKFIDNGYNVSLVLNRREFPIKNVNGTLAH